MSRLLPILFNTDMVRAILDGRKTVTRWICKDGNAFTVPDMSFYDVDKRTYAVHNYANREHTEKLSLVEHTCPICPGDILYVRETWERFECHCCEGDEHSGICINIPDENGGCYMYRASNEISGDARWNPSIHMPKEAARIWLKVKDVRVEHLQEMTASESTKEGIRLPGEYDTKERAYILAFADLWDSIIKKSDLDRYGWYANPWVWVIEFERCEKPNEEILQRGGSKK